MPKIMVVEDDQSLREIYSIRLTAEGYEVISAGDGEEALAIAVKERPDLIISDVMMPKISGFDMLDILRSTPETQSVKVIMMTALSSDDQKKRGESLGADKYLVKSQVGIEDVIAAVQEVLGIEASPNATEITEATVPAAVAAPVAPAGGAAPVPASTQPVSAPATVGTVQTPSPAQPVATPVSPQIAPMPVTTQPAPAPTVAPAPGALTQPTPAPITTAPAGGTVAPTTEPGAVAQPIPQGVPSAPEQPSAPTIPAQ